MHGGWIFFVRMSVLITVQTMARLRWVYFLALMELLFRSASATALRREELLCISDIVLRNTVIYLAMPDSWDVVPVKRSTYGVLRIVGKIVHTTYEGSFQKS